MRRILNIGGSFLSTDPDALIFISNWELNTGVTMLERQRNAVIELYKGLKGLNTTNGTDFWTECINNGAYIFPQVPLTDTTANALAYEVELVSNGVLKGEFIGFNPGDITINGVLGGTGKYFRPSSALNIYDDYDVTNFNLGFYSRTNNISTTMDWSQNGQNYCFTRISSTEMRWRLARTSDNRYFTMDSSQGLITNQNLVDVRSASKNGEFIGTNANLYDPVSSGTFVFHAYNNGSESFSLWSPRQLCLYYVGINALDQTRLDDWYELWQRFQTNIILGGRQI